MRLDQAYLRHAIGNRLPSEPPFTFNRNSLQARGLVGYWPMDRRLGNKGLLGGNLTITGALHQVNAFGGTGLFVDGVNDRAVSTQNFNDHDLLCVAGWFYLHGGHGNGEDDKIFELGGESRNTGGIGIEQTSSSTQWKAVIWGQPTGLVVITFTVPEDKFFHLLVASNAITGDNEIWLNGISVGTGSQTRGTLADRFTIGGKNDSPASRPGSAHVLDLRIYHGIKGSDALAQAMYDPASRWELLREVRVPLAWPKAASGGAVTLTAAGSLQAALRRQTSFLASIDTVVRAETLLSALASAGLEGKVSGSASLDLAVQVLRQAQADLDTVLTRSLGFDAGLDANLAAQGASQNAAVLDAAIRSLNLLSGAMEAALRAPNQNAAVLDAWLALRLGGTAGLDAVARRQGQLSSTALQGILRATPGRDAALDAIIGLVVAAAASRTQKIGARGGHRVAEGLRRIVIPSSNRRH